VNKRFRQLEAIVRIQSNAQITLKAAMEILSKTGTCLLLIVDENRKLIGSLSDGDIRKSILKNINLTDSIEDCYHRNPYVIFEDEFEIEEVKKIFIERKFGLIPIVDRNNTVVDFVTWEHIFDNTKNLHLSQIDAPVVIMAGGRGTRLEPFTEVLPKPLIPVGESTVIDQIIDRFRAFNIKDFYLTINHKAKIMRAYFDEIDPNYSINLVEEKEPLGTAGSLKLIESKLSVPFFVSNCDIIIEADYSDIYQFHIKGDFDITVVAAAKEFNIPYGICKLNDKGNLEKIEEKPEYNFLVNTGLYVLNPCVLELIPKDQFFHITHLIDKISEKNGAVGIYPVSEHSWVDFGQWSEYRDALKVIENR
jgi:dTDP-glucose pyrophosphorylase